jgi:peptide deformylase
MHAGIMARVDPNQIISASEPLSSHKIEDLACCYQEIPAMSSALRPNLRIVDEDMRRQPSTGQSGKGIMGKLQVVEWPAKVLETASEPVTSFDEQLRQFAADMHETMDAAEGIGLAANQVGIAKRVITIYIPFDDHAYKDQESVKQPWHNVRYTFVNPEIVKKAGKISWQEGCLSFPGIFDFVDRAAEVWIKAFDETGKPFEVHATELLAVCLQHEIDHIDGVVFFNRMSRLKASMIKKKMLRRGKLEMT